MNLWQILDRRAERRQRRWELRQLAKAQRIAARMTFVQRFRGPTERQGVTLGMFGLTILMLAMVRERPALWDVKLFEVVFQAVVLTGLLNMILAFHFAANKSDEVKDQLDAKRTENTGKLADAVIAAANAAPSQADPKKDAAEGAAQAADAAQGVAEDLAAGASPRPAGEDPAP